MRGHEARAKALAAGYPIVKCTEPGHLPEPGYVVCGHVAHRGAHVAEIVPATKEHVGQILCMAGKHLHAVKEGAILCCATCAREKGWLRT